MRQFTGNKNTGFSKDKKKIPLGWIILVVILAVGFKIGSTVVQNYQAQEKQLKLARQARAIPTCPGAKNIRVEPGKMIKITVNKDCWSDWINASWGNEYYHINYPHPISRLEVFYLDDYTHYKPPLILQNGDLLSPKKSRVFKIKLPDDANTQQALVSINLSDLP
jgi:hypothetical protein